MSIIIYGPVPVCTTADLHVGQRVTVDGEGVRPLCTVTVEGVSLAEATPTLGSTLSAAQDGLVWVLLHPAEDREIHYVHTGREDLDIREQHWVGTGIQGRDGPPDEHQPGRGRSAA